MSLEYRDHSSAVGLVKGPATTWSPPGQPYYVADPRVGLFLEQFDRGALVWNNVELRREHDPNGGIYSQTADGSMRLDDTPSSLYLAAALDKTDSLTKTLIEDLKEKRLTGLSVGFVPDKDRWTKAPDGRTELRRITRALLVEVSVVRKPANPGARIDEARHERRSDNGIEYRSFGLNVRETTEVPIPQVIRPPNLRPGNETASCALCEWFDSTNSQCTMYSQFPVRGSWLCDTFEAIDDTEPDDDADEMRKHVGRRTRLAPAGTEELVWAMRLRDQP